MTNNETAKWIGTNGHADETLHVHFDIDRTPYPGYHIASVEPIASRFGPAVLTTNDYKREEIEVVSVLPTSTTCPLVAGSVYERLLDEGADIEMHPTTIRCRDGETNRFYFARPMNLVDCIDLEHSQYDLNKYTKKIYDIDKLMLSDDCLGSRSIVRDRLADFVLVSDVLMNDVCKIIGGSEPFVKAEDFKL